MPKERLWTATFTQVWAANFFSLLSFALFFHLPGYLADLGAGEAQIGLIFSVAALASLAIRPFLGTAMDRYGRKPVILSGGVVNILFTLLYLTVSSLGPWVYAVRIGHGLAQAMLFTSLFTYGADVVPASRRSEGLAVFGVSGLLPMAFGGALGDLILSVGGFDQLFLVATGAAIVTLALSATLPERRPDGQHLDQPRGFFALWRIPSLQSILFVTAMFSFALTSYFVFIRRFVDETGIGTVGMFFAVYSIVAILTRVFFGQLADRVGQNRVLIPSFGLLIAGFLVLAAAGSWQAVAVAGALCGAGHGFAFPILLSMLVTRAPDADRGSAVAAFTAVIDVGTVVAGPLLGAIIDRRGFSTMYVFCAVFLAASVIAYGAWERRIAARSPETSVV